MKFLTLLAITLTLFTVDVHAAKFSCTGKYLGKSVEITGVLPNITSPKTAKGTVLVEGREVAEFQGRDADISYIYKTFKISNNLNEKIDGLVTDLQEGSAIITRLSIPAYGIYFIYFKINCYEI